MTGFAHSDEVVVRVAAPPERVFAHLDDQTRLAAHMEKPSAMMLGGRMGYRFDDAKGRAVGSMIKMTGDVLGLHLSIEEIVTEREPPRFKAWETRGEPRLLIIGSYWMGFEIASSDTGSRLRIFIEYDWPRSLIGPVLVAACAALYARWCVKRMAIDARAHFREGAVALATSARI